MDQFTHARGQKAGRHSHNTAHHGVGRNILATTYQTTNTAGERISLDASK